MTPPPMTPRRAGHGRQIQRAPGVENGFAVERGKGQLDRRRSRGQHHVLCLEQLRLATVRRVADLVPGQ